MKNQYVVIFTNYTNYQKYAVLVDDKSKRAAIQTAIKKVEGRFYDTVEVVELIVQ